MVNISPLDKTHESNNYKFGLFDKRAKCDGTAISFSLPKRWALNFHVNAVHEYHCISNKTCAVHEMRCDFRRNKSSDLCLHNNYD